VRGGEGVTQAGTWSVADGMVTVRTGFGSKTAPLGNSLPETGLDPSGKLVGAGDFRAQATQAFQITGQDGRRIWGVTTLSGAGETANLPERRRGALSSPHRRFLERTTRRQ
jgi:hypothetical protein